MAKCPSRLRYRSEAQNIDVQGDGRQRFNARKKKARLTLQVVVPTRGELSRYPVHPAVELPTDPREV